MSLQAPFPYFGGKRRVADKVWAALGDPDHYIEPFLDPAPCCSRARIGCRSVQKPFAIKTDSSRMRGEQYNFIPTKLRDGAIGPLIMLT